MSTPIRVGVIGAGMAGQAHAFGFRNAMMAVSSQIDVELVAIADPNLALAESVARRYGFAQATADVDAFIASDVDVISVALPNFLHIEVLSKVLASGKHVFAEKPIGRTPAEAKLLQFEAERSPSITGVGFSFRRLPGLAALARAVSLGTIGDIHTVRGWYYADYASNPASALSWRFSQEQSGGGALLDIGAHAIDAVHFVAGRITEVANAQLRTVITERPLPSRGAVGHGASGSNSLGPVTNDDIALLSVSFESGAIGQIALSRIARGMPNSLGVEVYGTRGSASFDSISSGEFHLFESDEVDDAYNGPKRIFTGPAHPYFSDVAAMPGAGVGTGYAEAFTAELQEFLRSVAEGTPMDTDFKTASQMMNVVGAALESSRSGKTVTVPEA